MAIFVFTGKLGSGKTLCAVGRMQEYLVQGRKVATNIDLNLPMLVGYKSKNCVVYRLPDVPTLADLETIGIGSDKYGEEHNGVIVLDECAQFLNTRNFQDKERKKLINWFVHARKKRWDVIFIIQHLNALDKQFRDLFAEHIVYCNRLDRLKWPLIVRPIVLALGFSPNLPKVHRALVMYGHGQNAMKVDSWVYTGKSLYSAFDTEQGFNDQAVGGVYQLIPPYYLNKEKTDGDYLKDKFVHWCNYLSIKMRNFFLLGLLSGVVGMAVANNSVFEEKEVVQTEANEVSIKDKPAPEPEQKIVIVGSILGDLTRTYFFQKGENLYFPEYDGYHVHPISECHALLLKDKQRIDARCAAAIARKRDIDAQRASDRLRSQESASGANNKGKQVEINSAENANPRDKE
jgi:hypothetical protein